MAVFLLCFTEIAKQLLQAVIHTDLLNTNDVKITSTYKPHLLLAMFVLTNYINDKTHTHTILVHVCHVLALYVGLRRRLTPIYAIKTRGRSSPQTSDTAN